MSDLTPNPAGLPVDMQSRWYFIADTDERKRANVILRDYFARGIEVPEYYTLEHVLRLP
jgi:hypothetical protein